MRSSRALAMRVYSLTFSSDCGSSHLGSSPLNRSRFKVQQQRSSVKADAQVTAFLLFHWLRAEIEHRNHRRVIAGAHLAVGRASRCFGCQSFAREDVIEPPTDIALAHLAPGRPPGEKIIVVRVERAADVDEPACQDAFEQFSFFRSLTD